MNARRRGIPHAFWNSGGEPARVMEIHVPATFGRFYDELGATMADASMSEQERREAQDGAPCPLWADLLLGPRPAADGALRCQAIGRGRQRHSTTDFLADRPRLQFGLQFTTVRCRPGKTDRRALAQLEPIRTDATRAANAVGSRVQRRSTATRPYTNEQRRAPTAPAQRAS